MSRLTVTLVMLLGLVVSAQGLAKSQVSTSQFKVGEYADYSHFFSVKAMSSGPRGGGLSYDYRLTPRWLIGVSGVAMNDSEYFEGGDLDSGEYYKESAGFEKKQLKINNTFYFRTNGYARWGFLAKAGVGYSWNKIHANYSRYDRDPAFIKLFSEKRYREGQSSNDKWEEFVANLGLYYQFAWNFSSTAMVGHVLQLGVNYLYEGSSRTVHYTKPSGQIKTFTSEFDPIAFEINYTIGF